VEHLLEELPGVLFDGDVHLQFEGDRSPVGVVRVRVVFRCPLGEPPRFTLLVDLIENRRETDTLVFELARKPLQCRWCEMATHSPLRFGRAR